VSIDRCQPIANDPCVLPASGDPSLAAHNTYRNRTGSGLLVTWILIHDIGAQHVWLFVPKRISVKKKWRQNEVEALNDDHIKGTDLPER